MESVVKRRVPAVPALVAVGLVLSLLGLAAVAWAVTDAQMRGMDRGPGTELGALGFYITVWVVMMAAMMFPSIAPMVIMHARVMRGRRNRPGLVSGGDTVAFVAGYLVAWALAGFVAYMVMASAHALSIGMLAWDRAGPYLAGAVIVGAAVYQLTPLKDSCLSRCRSPLMFLTSAWRDGFAGALRMGIEHGAWCVGCCWALMAALFALGVMSLGWMAFIAALIAIEKLLPWKTFSSRGIATVLLVLGLAVAFVPAEVPGLTLPDSVPGMEAMAERH